MNNQKKSFSAVFVTDSSDWMWALSFECALELKNSESQVVIVDLSQSKIRWFKGNSVADRTLKNSAITKLKDYGIEYSSKALKIAIPTLRIARTSSGSFDSRVGFQKMIYPSLVDNFKSTVIPISGIRNRLRILRELLLAKRLYRTLNSEDWSHLSAIFTVNGRYTKSKIIKHHFRSLDFPVRIIESGSTKTKFIIFENSAQSLIEANGMREQAWRAANKENRVIIGRQYFSDRLNVAPTSNNYWTTKMNQGKLPDLPSNKKICVFYSTSQIEFVGEDEIFSPGEFSNQDEALSTLLELLPVHEWLVILRKHPIPSKMEKYLDEEDNFIKSTTFENLLIIPGESSVDSYALAAKADLVATFGSSIGAEITFANLAPVITLAKTSWISCDSERHATTRQKLETNLANPIPILDGENMLSMGFYAATAGKSFRVIDYSESGWFFPN